MKKLFFSLILIITAFSNATLKAQQTKPADQIVAIVNDRIILKSEIDNDLRNYIMQSRNYGQQIEFSKDLWYQFLDGAVFRSIGNSYRPNFKAVSEAAPFFYHDQGGRSLPE